MEAGRIRELAIFPENKENSDTRKIRVPVSLVIREPTGKKTGKFFW